MSFRLYLCSRVRVLGDDDLDVLILLLGVLVKVDRLLDLFAGVSKIITCLAICVQCVHCFNVKVDLRSRKCSKQRHF